ncbi:MAG: DUF4258 domain-containing protein [Chloroflexi bacterium]|nr:DUF4258 domain-containing protein [Chloroflexota bacterium]
MQIKLTEHARERADERGATEDEIRLVLTTGEETKLKKGRKSKEMIFDYNRDWLGKSYPQKKVKAVYTEEDDQVIVITVKVYFGKWR